MKEPRSPGPRSAVLTYHSLDPSRSVLSTAPARFAEQMDRLADRGVPFVAASEAGRRPGSVAVTFDDGFASVLDHGLPVLERLRIPATLFVATGDGERIRALTRRATRGRLGWDPVPWRDLRSLPADLVEIGSHTVTHPDLTRLPPAGIDRELGDAKAELQDRLGRPVESLAYPFGRSDSVVRARARAHYARAYGTRLDYVDAEADSLDLPRIDAYYVRSGPWLDGLFDARCRAYLAFRRGLQMLRP